MNQNFEPCFLFDGHCVLCNGFVDFMLKHSKEVKFCPLQGVTAQKVFLDLKLKLSDSPDALGFYNGEELVWGPRAVLQALNFLGFGYQVLRVFEVLPNFILWPLYRFIAKNRYRAFGRMEVCRLPTEQDSQRLLP